MQLEYILAAHGLVRGGGPNKPLPDISNFTGSSNNAGTQISLSWQNPGILEFQKIELFMSDKDISNLSYEILKESGDLIADGKINNHQIKGLKHNDKRYFKVFAIFKILGEEEVGSGSFLSITTKDILPPGKVLNFRVEKEEETSLEIAWVNPKDLDFKKIILRYSKSKYPDSPSDGILGYDGSLESAVINNLETEVEYFFRIFTVDHAGNINDSKEGQTLKAVPSGKDDKSNSPGPKKLKKGTMEEGFFGFVPANEIFTGAEISKVCAVTEGDLQNGDVRWIKLAYKGKVLFRPQKSIRSSISWDHLSQKNVVFGGKTITKDNTEYKVRLHKGALTDPSENEASDRGAKGSEWNRVILPLSDQAATNNWDYKDYVEGDIQNWETNLTNEDLNTVSASGNGYRHWCQETPKSSASRRVFRGDDGVSYSRWYSSSYAISIYGWVPVLEVV